MVISRATSVMMLPNRNAARCWSAGAAILALLLIAGFSTFAAAASLDDEFRDPPQASLPWCYWYWLDDDVTAEGITRDLESMARTGIARAMIGNICIDGGGPVKTFSPEWFELTRHTLREAARLGVGIYMFNAPGWSQSGGPWIKPEQSMRRVAWNEFPAEAGKFSQKVRLDDVTPHGDIAVLALPRLDAVTIAGKPGPQVKSADAEPVMRFTHDEPFTARALVVHGQADARLYALRDGQRTLITEIQTGKPNKKTDFLPDGIETFSFTDVTAQEFELSPAPQCAVELTSEPMVAQVIEKQLGRMHPTPSPTWSSYIFPDTVEPGDASCIVKQSDILDLTDHLDADGVLTCELPAGSWTVIYFGMVSTGRTNHPASPEATGLEVDKMSRTHVEYLFHSMFDSILKNLTPQERSAFQGITIDSYEVGAQNWTDDFTAEFEQRNGYSPIKLLPVLTGRVIDSAKTSDQMLWDLRRTVADLIAENYIGGLRDIAHRHNLRLWCENYGHWGFPGEFLIYGGYSDQISGEFWSSNPLGQIECRAASSAVHTYGKRTVYAEAFTSKLNLEDHPYTIKARGEQLLCEGINHFVLHVYSHQPRASVPGKNQWFGTAFHWNNPWFNHARNWVRYLQRCHVMLEQGEPVADVAVYIGDFAPQMAGPADPVPDGYDYDYIGSDVILRRLQVVDSEWRVADENDPRRVAARWKVLAIPEFAARNVRPQVREKLEQLKEAGGVTVNTVPVSAETLRAIRIVPLVSEATCPLRFKARQLDDGMSIFLSNFDKTGPFEATLRVSGRTPRLYDPVSGDIRTMARYRTVDVGTRITLNVRDKADSFFVVFGNQPARPSVLNVRSLGKEVSPDVVDLWYDDDNRLTAETTTPGSYDLDMSDDTQRTFVVDAPAQTFSIDGLWNTVETQDDGYTIVQETEFDLPPDFGQGQVVYLDLGQVHVMAQVTLNGKEYDTLWMPPFALEVTDRLHAGANNLRVLVSSTCQGEPTIGPVQLRTAARVIVNP